MKKRSFIDELVHPDDRERIGEMIRGLLLNPGSPVVIYFRCLHKNGSYIDLEGVLINLLHRDYIRSLVFNLRDVTEQRRADQLLVAREKRFRSLIENSFDIILLLDEQFKVTYRSPSAVRISGRMICHRLTRGSNGCCFLRGGLSMPFSGISIQPENTCGWKAMLPTCCRMRT